VRGSGLVGREDDLDPLELLEVGVSGGGHRLAQRPDQVRRAVGDGGRTVEDLLERADAADLDAAAARELGVVRFGTPVEAATRCVRGAGERDAELTASAPIASALTMSPEVPTPPSAITCT